MSYAKDKDEDKDKDKERCLYTQNGHFRVAVTFFLSGILTCGLLQVFLRWPRLDRMRSLKAFRRLEG